MTTHLERIAARVVGRPLLIMPQKLGLIAQVLAGRIGLDLEAPELGLETPGRPEPLASRFAGTRRDKETGAGLPYVRTDAGVALITVTGSMVNRGAWIGANSGLTSYEGIAAQIRAAVADPKVSSILLDLDTPGGEATGAFELADLVRSANQAKPVTAFVNGLAASAGYLLASGAGRIVSVPSGDSGSIGVVMMHADYSRALDKAGITPTLIFSGDRKVDANPYQPLDSDTKTRLKGEVDTLREAFVQAVATGRGRRMSAKAARDTEAGIFTGTDAKAISLVDDLSTFDALHDELTRKASRTRASTGSRRNSMETDDITRARAEGAAEERSRIMAILTHSNAKGREAAAQHLAFESDMTAEAAGGLLAKLTKGSSTQSLAERAAAALVPIHTAATDRAQSEAVTIDAAAIYAAHNKPQPSL